LIEPLFIELASRTDREMLRVKRLNDKMERGMLEERVIQE
jgi:hypothetical protein